MTTGTISNAIAACMADIRPLAKGEKNQHGGYNFASVDDFLDLTRPICAKHKLDIRQDEESCEITGGQVFVRYAFTLHHGDAMEGPYRRSIAVNAKMGSQAFGAAQSYALKQFLRSLFQISTGEKDDIDFHAPEKLEDVKPEQPAKRENWGGRYPTKTKLKEGLHKHSAELERMADESSLDDFEGYITSPEYKDFIATAEDHAKVYLHGGDKAPPEFVPIYELERRTKARILEREPMNTAMAG